jgi:uroporphyrinogen III methyltransferase/synthase
LDYKLSNTGKSQNMLPQAYLIGAGIGSLDYLTHRAKNLLAQADILIYDDLVDTSILCLVPPHCAKIYVGKRGGKPSFSQGEINHLLIQHCQTGKVVIRLKSGDPGIFGRIYPEIQALAAAGLSFELVPGISSALAAPLLAGIPLTEKNLSRHFVVVSGHQPDSLNWQALAQIDTLVILMAGRTLNRIVSFLLAAGRSPDEPIIIIQNTGRANAQSWRGTLGTILADTQNISLSPCIIILGFVVNLGIMPTPLPLANKTILVTRAAEQASHFTQMLQGYGARVLEMPTLEIHPPSSWQALDNALHDLASFDWLILTSANAVDYFFSRLQVVGKDARALAGLKIAVVGKKTASSLEKHGIIPDFIPPDFVADSLVTHFPSPLRGQNILFPRVETGGREVLVKELSQAGATVLEVPAYESKCPREIDSEIWQAFQENQVDIITFASSKTVQNFVVLVTEALSLKANLNLTDLLKNITIASIGPQTSQTCYKLLGRVDLEAKEYTLEGLLEVLL